MSATLQHLHQAAFAPLIRRHGELLCRGGSTGLLDVTDTDVEASVRDGRRHHDVFLFDYADADRCLFSCTCPAGERDENCAHAWAVLVAVDELLLGITAEAGVEIGTDADEADAEHGNGTGRRATPPPRDDWRRRLQPLAADRLARAPGQVPLVIEYFLSLRYGGVVIQPRCRRRLRNGQLGAPRHGAVDIPQLQALPSADQSLLALYQEHAQARRGHPGYYGYVRQAPARLSLEQPWQVPFALLAVVLPLLQQTGRAFTAGESGAEPVQVDVEAPFRFVLELQQRGDRCAAVPWFVRGDERIDPSAGSGLGDEGYVVTDGRLIRYHCGGAAGLVNELLRRPLEVPATQRDELLAVLAALPGAAGFLAGALAGVPALQPIPVVHVTLPPAGKAAVTAVLGFDYGGAMVRADEPGVLVEEAEPPCRRDADVERAAAAAVAAAGMQAGVDGRFHCARAEFPAVVVALLAAGMRVLAEGKLVRGFRGGFGRVRLGLDWLDVEGEVQFDGLDAALPELLRRQAPDGMVDLGDGSFGVLPEHWLRRLEALRLCGGEVADGRVRLPRSQALLLDALLLARDGEFDFDAAFTALRQRLQSFAGLRPLDAPRGFHGELRPYQRHGLAWLRFLRDFGLGGCLADDMGLGKTVQVLALLQSLPKRRAVRPCLLVAPRSVLPNWLAEAQRFTPKLRVLDFGNADRWRQHGEHLQAADLVLTTYALLRQDAPKFADAGVRFHYAILDESQAAKNADSQTSKAVRLLAAEHRLALSGTPVENHLGELWSLFEFLNPGMLGRLPAFRGLFASQVSTERLQQNRELVQRVLRPVLLRRTKKEVLTDLPPKVEQTLWCELEPAQQRRYDELARHYRQRLLEDEGEDELGPEQRFVILEALLRLRQAACHEALLDPTRREAASAKLEVLLPRLEQLAEEGHKALVFSQFTSFLDLVEPQLRSRGLPFERLDGQTRDRQARVQRFQEDPDCRVFLISLKAGGFGLNLTAASYVFVLDPWWNPAAELQAIDRAHRIGQQRTVHAYRLVCKRTVEERVVELQQKKRALCEAILGNERSLLQDLTRADLELLLG